MKTTRIPRNKILQKKSPDNRIYTNQLYIPNMKRVILLCVAAIVSTLATYAIYNDSRRTFLIDSLHSALPEAKTYNDSVSIYYDLFDLHTRRDKKTDGMVLLYLAAAHNDESVQLDIARRIASASASIDTAICTTLLRHVEKMPESRERDATRSFIFLTKMRSEAIDSSEKVRQQRLNEYLHRYREDKDITPTENMEMLFVICSYLDITVPGDMLAKYINKLEEAIKKLPFHLYGIYNMYYLDASIIYSNFGDADKAVEANKKLLDIIDKLAEQSRAQNRRYRDYATHYYNTYRRILSNYTALTDNEVEYYYDRIKALTETSLDCHYDFNNSQRPTIYYLMAKKRYGEALTILKKQIDNPANASSRRLLYKQMLQAATEIDDKGAMLQAAMAYNQILENYLIQNSIERGRELQTLYDLNSLQAEKTALELENKEGELGRRHIKYVIILIAAGILLILLLLILMLYLRARRSSTNLEASNALLLEERDKLQHIQRELIEARDRARKADNHKAEFINNMSHEVSTPVNTIVEYSRLIVDNMSEEKRKYIGKYAQIVELSADMLRTIVNDVIDIAAMDNSMTSPSINSYSIKTLCEVAIESVKKYRPEGVSLRFVNSGNDDDVINTDGKRVEQVLINLLTNGLKFTETGSVELSYSIDTDNHTATFAITDTGIGVPEGKEEVIFERFEKLSTMTQGLGLGLNICRMVANLLHGKVYLDTTYTKSGSRFLFTIPI